MAGSVGTGPAAERRRVFVLVDKGTLQGVFPSWDAAEAYADEHRLSLDHLLEFETLADHPDHLHLMAARWDAQWTFQGQWSRTPPDWKEPPKKIRLDHFHAVGGGFKILRQKEFDWQQGLLDRIDPMAPEAAMVTEPPPRPEPPPQWKPKLAALKPVPPAPPPRPTPPVTAASPDPAHSASPPPPVPARTASPVPVKIDLPAPPPKVQPSLRKPLLEEPPVPDPAPAGAPPPEQPGAKPRISFQKKSQLRLRSKGAPQPIPSFKPTVAPPLDPLGRPTVEIAQQDQAAQAKAAAEAEKLQDKPRRIWALRFIITMAALPVCWAIGLYAVLRPEPTAASIVAQVSTLANARVIILEPKMVFFQLPVEPIHQLRWIESLGLQPIPNDTVVQIPFFHSLDTWARPEGFVRPPYSLTEVSEWWDLRLRKVQYGFTYTWDDGSILILDLESDLLIGWAPAARLPELLN